MRSWWQAWASGVGVGLSAAAIFISAGCGGDTPIEVTVSRAEVTLPVAAKREMTNAELVEKFERERTYWKEDTRAVAIGLLRIAEAIEHATEAYREINSKRQAEDQ